MYSTHKQLAKGLKQVQKQQRKDIDSDLKDLANKFFSLDLQTQQDILNAVNIILKSLRDA